MCLTHFILSFVTVPNITGMGHLKIVKVSPDCCTFVCKTDKTGTEFTRRTLFKKQLTLILRYKYYVCGFNSR